MVLWLLFADDTDTEGDLSEFEWSIWSSTEELSAGEEPEAEERSVLADVSFSDLGEKEESYWIYRK